MNRGVISLILLVSLLTSCTESKNLPLMKGYQVFDVDVEEISGLCLNADKSALISCGDQGVVKQLSFEGEAIDILVYPADMEGVTIDPSTGDLYLAIEGSQEVARLAAPAYDTYESLFKVQEAIDSNYRNGGLEGVEYYKHDILFVGSQVDANLWQYRTDGTIVSKISFAAFATEIAGLCYEPEEDLLWVTDSRQAKIFLCRTDGTLLATYEVPFVDNLESICVDRERECIWVASDEDSPKLYRLDFDFEGGRVIVAYVTSWTDEIPDPSVMTHINYAFAHVNDTFDGVRVDNPERLKDIVALKAKNPALNVMVSVGGWGSGRFSEMASDDGRRMSFAEDCLRLVEEFGLDGIDIDWEYPTSDAAGISASPEDRENFNLLMRDLRSVLGPDRLLTLASSAYAEYIDFRSCMCYLDFVNVMTYDMADAPKHHSPLYASGNTKGSCKGAVKAHVEAGVPVYRLVLGVPFYGRGGEVMKSRDYKDIRPEGEFVEMWDDVAQAPYIADKDGNLVLGYDNPRSLSLKCGFIKENGLLGAMYWDYAGDNGSGDLQKTLSKELLGKVK